MAHKGEGCCFTTLLNVPATADFFKVDTNLLYDRSENDKAYIRDRNTPRASPEPEVSGIVVEPLDQRKAQLRVLVLGPAERDDGTIIGKLTALDFYDTARHPYTALSYAGGSLREYSTIYVDQRPVRVRRCLHTALLELRRRGHYRIWTDFICINQADVHGERPQQLRQMHNIYRMATQVVAWLSESDTATDYMVETMDEVRVLRQGAHLKAPGAFLHDVYQLWLREEQANHDMQPYIHKFLWDTRDRRNLIALFDKLRPEVSSQVANLQARVLEFLDAVRRFVEKGYWRRAWIIQELSAGAAIEIWCGEFTLDYPTFISILKEMKFLQLLERVNLGFSQLHEQVLNLDHLRAKWQPSDSMDMIEAFYHTYHAQSGRKHDEIYSIWALGHNSALYVPDFDYRMPMERLIRQMTEFKILQSKSLDLICMQSLEPSPFALPSWTPDFRLIGKYPFNARMAEYLTKWDKQHVQSWTATCGSKCTDVAFSADRRLLRVRCCSVGRITQSLPPASSLSSNDSPRSSSSSSWMRARRDHKLHNAEAASIFEAMMLHKAPDPMQDENSSWNTVLSPLVRDYYQEKSPLTHAWLTAFSSARFGRDPKPLGQWSKGKVLRLGAGAVRRGVDWLNRRGPKEKGHLRHLSPVDRAVIHAFDRVIRDDLRFFEIRYESGDEPNVFGWAHPNAALGDQVCLLQGCSMPVVLRATEEMVDEYPLFKVIGDAYVAGAMQGQAWTYASRSLKHVYLS